MKKASKSPPANIQMEVRKLREFLMNAKAERDKSRELHRDVGRSFFKGIAYGFGALLAVAIVAPLVVWLLQTVAWPPLIANIVTQVIDQIQQANPR